VVGRGTPGRDYAKNGHSAGFMVLDLLAGRLGGSFKAHRGRAEVLEARLAGRPVVLVKPRTYMNLSGGPVQAVSAFYKVPPDRLGVVHDELGLPYGVLPLKFGGCDGGPNRPKAWARGPRPPPYNPVA